MSKVDELRALREQRFSNNLVRDSATSVRDKPDRVRDIPPAVRDATVPASTLATDPQAAMTDAERQARYRSAHLPEVRARERDRKRQARAK